MRNHLFVAACAAAVSLLGVGVAVADPAPAPATSYAIVPQAVIGGDYSYISANHGGAANDFGGEAGGILPFGGGFSGQVEGAYHNLSENHGGGSADVYDVGGALAWSNDMGRIGANVAYSNVSSGGVNGSVTNYGVFGEYYAGDQFTIGLRGGGASLQGSGTFGGLGGSGSTTGGYVGAELVGYATPDFDVQGHVEYDGIKQGSQTRVGVMAEWLFSEEIPISGTVGYDYTTLSGGGASESTNTVSVGLHYYIGGNGSLVQRHRSGVDGFGAAPVQLIY
jgi:hypothetical protein